MTSAIWLTANKTQTCFSPWESPAANFFFYSYTRSCSYLTWVYAIMFMFWPVHITHQIEHYFGYRNQTSLDVIYQASNENTQDSDSSSDDGLMLFKEDKQKVPAKSPKNAATLNEDGTSSNGVFSFRTKSRNIVESESDLKPGEHISSIYGPSGGILT